MLQKQRNKRPYLFNLSLAWINDPDFLVLTRGGNEATIVVPGDGVDDVRVHASESQGFVPACRVPDDNLVVEPNRGEDVGSTWVPGKVKNL